MPRKLIPYAAIIAFICLVYIRNILPVKGFQTFIFGDSAIYALQITGLSQNFSTIFGYKDNFLFWNPSYLSIGIPTASVIDFGVFYPVNIFIAFIAFLIKNPFITFNLYTLSIFAHLVFGSIFIYKILTDFWKLNQKIALIGALIWSFNGYNTEFMSASAIFLAASYLPACFYFTLKILESDKFKYFLIYHLLLAFSFLSGYVIVPVIIFLFCSFYYYFSQSELSKKKKALKVLTGLFLITLPLVAPLYFSTYINFPYSLRSLNLDLESFLFNSAKITNLIESVFPKNTPFNDLSKTNQVFLYFSLTGILILLLNRTYRNIFSERRNKLLLLLGIVGLLIAIGKYGFISYLLYYIPGIGLFRRLSVFSLVPLFTYSLLIPQILRNIYELKNSKYTSIFKVILIVSVFIFILTSFLYFTRQPLEIELSSFYTSFIIGFAVLVIVAISYKLRHLNNNYLLYGLILAVFVEAFVNVSSKAFINSRINPKDIFVPNSLMTSLINIVKEGERVNVLHTHYNYSTSHLNLDQTAGYVSLASLYGGKINEYLESADSENGNLKDLLGVKYVINKAGKTNSNLKMIEKEDSSEFYEFNYLNLEWEKGKPQDVYAIYSRETNLPRLYVASRVEKSDQSAQLLDKIRSSEKNTAVFVNEEAPADITSSAEVNIQEIKRNYLRAEVKSGGKVFLANSTGYYPGWKVKINGEWRNPIQTNWFMQGVFLSSGNNVVEFYYIPYGIILGLIYLFTALFVWILFFAFRIRLYAFIKKKFN
ncbi:hypothetical protein A3A69_00560 [candidate division WWE3 bacterium RIFCSPLOWO2_01_FULL_37_15]|uniref:Membrane protein 6-pyruvoyl-tetrahydropterin synthase-related domain-containing protein n=1 Tax=candidate division WWE3 bacterium RIFCSPLOWO2_01_FULL_37_15 TaxID=1802622 RepID=A0A1F4UT63_UNCKA|nr:MAG: hypothetical protein A3A69_00560 [candidate division WWE3 bacterium RIFCSPLOWO2_01_FULL_37_15]